MRGMRLRSDLPKVTDKWYCWNLTTDLFTLVCWIINEWRTLAYINDKHSSFTRKLRSLEILKASCDQSGSHLQSGTEMIHLSDPGSITEAAGEAHGSKVPLENFGEKSPPRSWHQAVPSLGCSHGGGSMRTGTPLGSLGTCSELWCSVRLFLRNPSFPLSSQVSHLCCSLNDLPLPPVPFPLSFHSISAIVYLHF